MARATILAVGRSRGARPVVDCMPGQFRWRIAAMIPGRAVMTRPSAARPSSRSRRQMPRLPVPVRSHCRSGAERKTSGSMNGTLLPRRAAAWWLSRSRSFFALRLASLSGLSVEARRPSVSHVHVPASPVSRPGRLLISTRKNPYGAKTSKSTSLTVPSRAMNSNSDHAR